MLRAHFSKDISNLWFWWCTWSKAHPSASRNPAVSPQHHLHSGVCWLNRGCSAVPRSHLQGVMGAMVESSAQALGHSWWALQGASVMDSRPGFHFFVISKCRTKLTPSVFLHWTSCAKHWPTELCVLSSPGLKFGSLEHKVELRAFGVGHCLFCLMDCLKRHHRDEIRLRFVNVNKQFMNYVQFWFCVGGC